MYLFSAVSISQDAGAIAVILAKPVMIDALGWDSWHGKSFPRRLQDGKVDWKPKPSETFPAATVPGTLDNVDFMERDSKRFADTGGWGWAVFDYTTASDT